MTYKLRITGKVQGVWYRASAKDKAMALGLTGQVWNEKDGAVGAVVQGTEQQVRDFIAWCHEGPPLARVNEVAFEEVIKDSPYEGFEIVR